MSNSQIENCLKSNCSPQSSSNGSKPGFLGKLPRLQSTKNAMASVEVMSVQLLVMIKKLIKDFIQIREREGILKCFKNPFSFSDLDKILYRLQNPNEKLDSHPVDRRHSIFGAL